MGKRDSQKRVKCKAGCLPEKGHQGEVARRGQVGMMVEVYAH